MFEVNFDWITWELTTVVAIVVGPIAAVQAEKWLERRREANRRRIDVFRTLMTTRAAILSFPYVEALNRIDLEFHDKNFSAVRTKWKVLLSHYDDGPKTDEPNYEQLYTNWNSKLTDILGSLLMTMGSSLGYNFDAVEIKKGIYAPRGHADDEAQLRLTRHAALRILTGQDALTIKFPEPEGEDALRMRDRLVGLATGDTTISVKLVEKNDSQEHGE